MKRKADGSEKNHNHHEHCEHEEVAFCGHCQVVYCKNCNRQWSDCKRSHSPLSWYYQVPGGTAASDLGATYGCTDTLTGAPTDSTYTTEGHSCSHV